jgi:dynein heavy chain, axonemal
MVQCACVASPPTTSGKTETVKDLAKALGVQCVVFNCGEGLDYKAMGSIFAGLVQCGAWGCFDEFNRIDAEVLSVVSSQIKQVNPTDCSLIACGDNLMLAVHKQFPLPRLSIAAVHHHLPRLSIAAVHHHLRCMCTQIQEALKNDVRRFQFEGREIGLDSRTGIFVTMNPGYAGRTELPDNLKALFRPVTMVVPDMEQICEIMLFSEGFDAAKVSCAQTESKSQHYPAHCSLPLCAAGHQGALSSLPCACIRSPQALAKKMTVLYQLAREQLSKQYHYDFGLRALKSVLVMAGALKRSAVGTPETLVLMRALRDSNLPKFVYDDVPLFLGLIADLFPGKYIGCLATCIHTAPDASDGNKYHASLVFVVGRHMTCDSFHMTCIALHCIALHNDSSAVCG